MASYVKILDIIRKDFPDISYKDAQVYSGRIFRSIKKGSIKIDDLSIYVSRYISSERDDSSFSVIRG